MTQAIISDALGTKIGAVPICTMTGLQYISVDISQNTDTNQNQDHSKNSQNCPFCQTHSLVFITPSLNNKLGFKTAYSERLKINQYRAVFYKTTVQIPQPRGPPEISFL